MSITKNQTILIYFLVGLFVMPFTWFAVYKTWPVSVPIVWDGLHYITPPVLIPNTIAYVHREFQVYYPVSLTIERKFIKKNNGNLMMVELPRTEVFYEPGRYKQDRSFIVPCVLSTGTWSLVNSVTFQDELGRTHLINPPVINVEVMGSCK